MPSYYRGKKAGRARGWMRRNVGRAGSALKKRYTSGGKLSLAKVASDAKYALSIAKTARGLLNTEKKRHEWNSYNSTISQVNANAANWWSYEVTPTISQGTGYGNRTGSSISFRSMHTQGQIIQQTNCSQRMGIKLMLIQTTDGDDFTMSEFLMYNKFLYAQNTVAIYDTQCERDPDYFKKYKVLRTKYLVLNRDWYNGGTNYPLVTSFKFGVKFGRNGKHVRFNDNTNTPVGNRFFIVAIADTGNSNTSTASTLTGISTTGTSTGATFNIEGTNYYIDN